MILIRLEQDIGGLGQEGSLAVCDRTIPGKPGDWVVVKAGGEVRCVPYDPEVEEGAVVLEISDP